jgi:hypothetical protein
MSPLQSQKQLLITESELNRAQLVQEWQTMSSDVHTLAEQAGTIRSIASSVATLVAGLSSLRQKKTAPASEKTSWWQTILKGAGTVSSVWSELRSSRRE